VVASAGSDHELVLGALRRTLHDSFGIDHITIQLEPPGFVEQHRRC
jgi:hypothetical protein